MTNWYLDDKVQMPLASSTATIILVSTNFYNFLFYPSLYSAKPADFYTTHQSILVLPTV